MVRQHEDRVLEGRVVAPPAPPVLVGPGAAERAEHVAAHDGGAHALEGPGRVAVVQPRAAPSPPRMDLKVRVGKNQFMIWMAFLPKGSDWLCWSPAPKPS